VKYLLRRLGYLLVVLFAVTFLVSVMMDFIPGEPAYVIIGENATPAQIAQVHKELRLDDPVVTKYVRWVGNALHGDFGRSFRGNQPISKQLKQRLPVTLELVILSQVVALGFAFIMASYGSYKPKGVVDGGATFLSFGMISTPQFVLALVLMYIFGVKLHWFPVSNFTHITKSLSGNLKSVALPVLAISADPAGVYQRVLRSDMGRTLREDYITMAQAKGLSPGRILVRHGLRPSLFSTTTLAGITTARLIGGSVIIETIFSLPGIGQMLIQAINGHDYIAVQAVVGVVAVGYVVINTLVDLLYGVLDPRVLAK